MRILELLLLPFVLILNGIGNGIFKLPGVERTAVTDERYRTVDELSFIVAESRTQRLLDREPARVIQELLDFSELTAGEVMVPRTRVVALPLDATARAVAAALQEERHTRFPVHQGDLDHIADRVDFDGVVLEVSAIRGKGLQEARVVTAASPD